MRTKKFDREAIAAAILANPNVTRRGIAKQFGCSRAVIISVAREIADRRRPGRKLLPEQRRAIIDALRAGRTIRSIIANHQTGHHTIHAIAASIGLDLKPQIGRPKQTHADPRV